MSVAEVDELDAIFDQAAVNDVEGMAKLTKAQALAMEPELACEAALISAESGVFDSHGYMVALQGEIEAAGGAVVVSTPFEGAVPLDGGGFEVRTGGAEPATLTCRYLVTSAGLSAQGVAAKIKAGNLADLIIVEDHDGAASGTPEGATFLRLTAYLTKALAERIFRRRVLVFKPFFSSQT